MSLSAAGDSRKQIIAVLALLSAGNFSVGTDAFLSPQIRWRYSKLLLLMVEECFCGYAWVRPAACPSQTCGENKAGTVAWGWHAIPRGIWVRNETKGPNAIEGHYDYVIIGAGTAGCVLADWFGRCRPCAFCVDALAVRHVLLHNPQVFSRRPAATEASLVMISVSDISTCLSLFLSLPGQVKACARKGASSGHAD